METWQTIIAAVAALVLTGLGDNLPVVGPILKALRAALNLAKPPDVPKDGEKITGRPILDLLAHAAIKQYGSQPTLVALIVQFAKQVDQMLDDAGVPELPINPVNPQEE